MIYSTKATNIQLNDQTIDVLFEDGINITIKHNDDYFLGWLTPLSIPEYFKLGISPDQYTIIWPNGYEAQLYEDHEYAKQNNVDVIQVGYNWIEYNILSKQELYDLLSQPMCEDYLEVCEDIEFVTEQIEKLKQSIQL